MSYILDALRKADAQRQRERPGLHAQPIAAGNERRAAAWLRMPAVWIGALMLVVAGTLAVLWPSTPQAPASQAARAPVVVAPPAAEAVPVPPPVAAAKIDPPPPPMPAPVLAPPPPRVASPPPQAKAPVVASTAAPSPAASAAPVAKAGAEGPAPADAPKLAITGGVYSQDPAQRMLIVGGQVFNEGSQLAPGVVLEQVRPHQALLSFRGQRYTVGY